MPRYGPTFPAPRRRCILRDPRLWVPLVFFFLIFCSAASPCVQAAESNPPGPAEIQSLILKCRDDAEKKLVTAMGKSKFLSLKQKILTAYPTPKPPSAGGMSACPGIDYRGKLLGGASKAQVTGPGGPFFLAGYEAVFYGQVEIAQWSFASASHLSPSCPVYLSSLAFVLNLKGDYPAASDLLKFAQSLAPAMSSIWSNLAYSYLKQELFEKAVLCYLVAVSLEPQIEEYQQMLILAHAAKAEAASQTAASKTVSPSKAAGAKNLDSALGLLEEKKQSEFKKDLSNLTKKPPVPKPSDKTKSIDPFEIDRRFSPPGGSASSESGSFFGAGSLQFGVKDLITAADLAEEKASKAKKDKDLKPWQRKLVSAAGLSMSALFRCYAAQAAGILASESGDRRMLDEIREKGEKDRETLEGLEKPPKPGAGEKEETESAPISFFMGPLCITKQADGTYEFEVGAGIIGGEFIYNPKTYNLGVKVSLGYEGKVGLGSVGAKSEATAFFQVDLDKGPVVGTELSTGAGLGMGGETFGPGTKFVREISLENLLQELQKPPEKTSGPGGIDPPKELPPPEERYKIGRAPDQWPEPTEKEKVFKRLGIPESLLRQRIAEALQSGDSTCGAALGRLYKEIRTF
jgi:tetratricopeptide (TPR) repeat protein